MKENVKRMILSYQQCLLKTLILFQNNKCPQMKINRVRNNSYIILNLNDDRIIRSTISLSGSNNFYWMLNPSTLTFSVNMVKEQWISFDTNFCIFHFVLTKMDLKGLTMVVHNCRVWGSGLGDNDLQSQNWEPWNC